MTGTLLPLILSFAAAVTAPAAPKALTLDEALAITRKQQPALREAEAAAAAAEYRTSSARSQYFPQLSAMARFQRSGTALFNSQAAPGDSVSEFFGPNALDRYNASLTLNQLLFDFGRTPQQVAAAKASEKSAAASFQNAEVESAYATRTAFFQAQAARALRDSRQQALDNQRQHAAFIKAQVEVGLRPPIDRMQAAADLATAELQLIQAANNYETAKARLVEAMGEAGFGPFEVTGPSLPPLEEEEAEPEKLLEPALNARPDARAIAMQTEARLHSVSALRRSYWPTLVGSASVSEGGPSVNDLDGSWSLGLALNWSLFEGGATRAQIGEATQNLRAVEAQAARLRLAVANELHQAILTIRAAKAAEAAAAEAVRSAAERLRLAEARYRTGLGSIIELSDAQTRATDAEAQQIEARFNLALARSALLRALGRP